MKTRLVRAIVATTLMTTAVGSSGCGYFLHPERRGNTGGSIDGASLVMDLLWLLPGIVPGVIALVVDFSSGAIYTGHSGRSAVLLPPKGHVAVRVPPSSKPMELEFRLVTSDRRVLAKKTMVVGPNEGGESVALQIGDSTRLQPNEKIFLEVASADGVARFATSMEVAR